MNVMVCGLQYVYTLSFDVLVSPNSAGNYDFCGFFPVSSLLFSSLFCSGEERVKGNGMMPTTTCMSRMHAHFNLSL